MKSKEEIEQLAEQDFNDRQECGHYELADLKSRDYYYDGFTNGYTQCQEDMKPLLKDLFSLWQSLAEVGEIGIGQNFTKNYEELKNSLNKQD
jgi:hypothetical protein